MNKNKPYLAVILVQVIYTGMFLLSKAAFNGGMNNFVFVFYRQAAGTLALGPIALVLERKNFPRLSFVTFCKIFMLSLFGITLSLDANGVGLMYTSASLTAATTNSLPAITFFLAFLLRKEVLKVKTKQGIAKLMGVLTCIGGAGTLALYKGPHFKLLCLRHLHSIQQPHNVSSPTTWIKGCFIVLLSNSLWALWLILQAPVLKCYPSKLLLTALTCFLSSIQAFAIAIGLVRDPEEWKLGWNVRLLAVAYCGILVTGVTFYLQAWIVEKKGPVFMAMSNPLNFLFTLISSAILLCESFTLGSLLGGGLLVGGLYSVLWGKYKEEKLNELNCSLLNNNGVNLDDKECLELKQLDQKSGTRQKSSLPV